MEVEDDVYRILFHPSKSSTLDRCGEGFVLVVPFLLATTTIVVPTCP